MQSAKVRSQKQHAVVPATFSGSSSEAITPKTGRIGGKMINHYGHEVWRVHRVAG